MAKKRKPADNPDLLPAPALRLEWRSPGELAENPRNWRRHPEAQLAALGDVLGEVGWAGACLFNERTGRLIDGHARRKVALEQGCDRVPVLVGSWDEATEAKILATLDPLAAMAEADAAALDGLLREVQTGSQAVADLLEGLAAQAGVVPPEVTPGQGGDEFDVVAAAEEGPCRVQAGDLWLVDGGKHRVLCGDSTKGEDVARVMAGERAGLCFTSPPYAQQRDYGEAAKEKVRDWDGLMRGVFGCLGQVMADDGQVLVNLGLVHREGEWWPYWDGWIEWMREQGWRRFGWYVWDQGWGLMGDWAGRLAPSHEFLFHFNKVARKPNKTLENKTAGEVINGTMRGKDGVLRLMTQNGQERGTHKIPDSVVRVRRQVGALGEGDHPAVFSVCLPEFIHPVWTDSNGIVYEPFLGSGTSIIAAHRTGRRCYGLEIEPRYCEVVLRRAEAEGLAVEKAP